MWCFYKLENEYTTKLNFTLQPLLKINLYTNKLSLCYTNPLCEQGLKTKFWKGTECNYSNDVMENPNHKYQGLEPVVIATHYFFIYLIFLSRELGKLRQGDINTKLATGNLSHTNIGLNSLIMNCTNQENVTTHAVDDSRSWVRIPPM